MGGPYCLAGLHSIFSKALTLFPKLLVLAEIVELVELLQPSEEEVAARNAAVEAVADAVKGIWPTATVRVFGSFATGG
jgi:non-canonical poly(A) RNA polymerase PAPD5/7